MKTKENIQANTIAFFIFVVIPLQAIILTTKFNTEIVMKILPYIYITILYSLDHAKPRNKNIQTKFPGVFEYLCIQ